MQFYQVEAWMMRFLYVPNGLPFTSPTLLEK